VATDYRQEGPGLAHNAGASRRLEGFTVSFFHDVLAGPKEELNTLRATELWAPIIAHAKSSLNDLCALRRYDFKPDRFQKLMTPILLQIGTERLGICTSLSRSLRSTTISASTRA
jgi:hypothetical protein